MQWTVGSIDDQHQLRQGDVNIAIEDRGCV